MMRLSAVHACRCALVAIALAVSAFAVQAQTADELIAKNIEAKGGLAQIEAIKSLRTTGTMDVSGFRIEGEIEQKPDFLVRQSFTVQGMTQVQAYDGSIGWQINPFQGRRDPERMGEDDVRDMVESSDFYGPLVDYKEKGSTVQYIGHDTVDGDDALLLKVTLKNGDVINYYLDPDTYLEIRTVRLMFVRGSVHETFTNMGSYKKVNGVYFPFSIETGSPRNPSGVAKLTITKIEANIDIPDSEFQMPGTATSPSSHASAGTGPSAPAAESAAPPPAAVPDHAPTSPATPVRFDSGTISGLPARNIGSAAMSGRIAALAGVKDGGRTTIYVGSASGGVWKSIDGGSNFRPIFDRQKVQSIGAIAIDPSNSKNIWVGTGESWERNSASMGDGIYRSTDGGDNWTNVGLPNSERIAKVLVDPTDGKTVYVCVTGHAYDDSPDRGVYKTSDDGQTWRKVLGGANGSTGCGMLSMNAGEPDVIYATMWDFRRHAWTFRSGGPGSGIFKSTDKGEHWTEIDDSTATGLPKKPYGRIAIAVAPSNPKVVYAMIESANSALYRSNDAGKTWNKMDASQYMVWRPFYFANLIVDPKNENKVFKVDGILLLSTDGGKSFQNTAPSTHGDHHDVWISPDNPNLIFTGDDGGLWRSQDGGTGWEHMMNLPISQFYHVSVDDDDPYHVYGGLQDNSSWVGDSSYPGGVNNEQWENMYGGDGFWMWVDPTDPTYLYAESQGGTLGRVNRYTHETRALAPYAQYSDKKLRFNWNTPVQISPTDKKTLYIGCQYLYRTRNQGQTWERISPDLTTNNPEKQKQEESGGVTIDNSSAEMNNTVYSISESPKNDKVIWVGTDDGNVQLTRDAGAHWSNLTAKVGIGGQPIVSWVEASRFAEGTAYVTFDTHMNGDPTPHVFKTTDYGQSWRELDTASSHVRGYAHVIKEDIVDPDLLFLGTEFGLWVSIDGGAHWAAYTGSGFPSVPVRDLVIQPRTSDLVLATHGRGIWIIDDISPWRSLTPSLMTEDAAFFPPVPVIQHVTAYAGWPDGDNSFTGPARPQDAAITYYQRTRHIFGDLKIEVFDAQGNLVDTVASSKHRGVNRATWSMRLKAPKVPPAASAMFQAAQGPRVLPGVYTVKMTKGDKVYTTTLSIVMDPHAPYTLADRKQQLALTLKIGGMLNHMSWAVDAIVAVRDTALADAAKVDANDDLHVKLVALAKSADDIRTKIVATKEGGAITGEERLREYTGDLYGDVSQYEGRPTDEQVARADVLRRQLDDVVGEFNQLTARQLPAINAQLKAKNLKVIEVVSEQDWQKVTVSETSSANAVMAMQMREGDRD